jgi:hypothetical protein
VPARSDGSYSRISTLPSPMRPRWMVTVSLLLLVYLVALALCSRGREGGESGRPWRLARLYINGQNIRLAKGPVCKYK